MLTLQQIVCTSGVLNSAECWVADYLYANLGVVRRFTTAQLSNQSGISIGRLRSALRRLEEDFDIVREGRRRGQWLVPTYDERVRARKEAVQRDRFETLARNLAEAYPQLGIEPGYAYRGTVTVSIEALAKLLDELGYDGG